jgi:hypothetical protein
VRRNGRGAVGVSEFETALVILSLSPVTANTGDFQAAAEALSAAQSTDGSWGDDVYGTALVARALKAWRDGPAVTVGSSGSLAGRVIDATSGLPLRGVSVRLLARVSLFAGTDNGGAFRLTDIPPGSYTIAYTVDGYTDATASMTVNLGQHIDVGTVALAPLAASTVIQGVVTDAVTGQPVANAKVTEEGAAADAATDAQGGYRLLASEGRRTVSAAAPGYRSVSVPADLGTGGTWQFSPSLIPEGALPAGFVIPSTATVVGPVVDAGTEQPLPGVQLVLAGDATPTFSSNVGRISRAGLMPGGLSVTLSLPGYSDAHIGLLASAGAADLGTIRLSPLPTAAIATGTVTDAASGHPLAGAQIRLEGATPVATVTDATGLYRLVAPRGVPR